MWEAKPLLTFDWLTVADAAVITLGCLILLVISLWLDYRDRKRQQRIQRIQRKLDQSSVLDRNRVIHRL